jgi:translocation and assembly module TamA
VAFLERLAADGARYAGFSLLVGDAGEAAYWSNRADGAPVRLDPGIYGLSNGLLDTPWPKLTRTRERFARLLAGGAPSLDRLLELMTDREPAGERDLPDTGIGAERERFLSPAFVVGPAYGTRCTTALAIDARGAARRRGTLVRPGRPGTRHAPVRARSGRGVTRPRRPGARRFAAALAATALLASAAPAGADIRVSVEGVEGAIRTNVLAYLSLQRYSTLDDLDPDLVNRLVQRAEGEVTDALRPFGYYAPTVAAELTGDRKRWFAHIVITPGEPVLLTDVDVEIDGPGRDEPFLREVLAEERLQPGQQLNHGTYETLKGELQRRAAANGYLDARFTLAELLVDPEARTAVARLRLETGSRYRFGAIEIDEDTLEPRLVQRFLRFREGEWYNSGALLRTQFALDDTAYFDLVEVLPGDRDPETLTVPVRILTNPNQRNRYTIGVGYETDYGPRIRLGWENRRLNRRGHRFRFEANVASQNQSGSATYVVPIGDPALEKVELRASLSNERLADVDTRAFTVRPSVTHVLGRWQRATFVDFLRSDSTAGSQTRSDTLVVPGVSFAPVPRSFVGQYADSGQGFFGQLVGSSQALGSRSNFVQLRVRNDWRWTVAPKWHVLARGDLGATAVENFEDLPAQYRYFAGGDRAVRGFGFNTLSPVQCVPDPERIAVDPATCAVPGGEPGSGGELLRTGGRHLFVASIELERDLPRNFAVAVFADAGNAFNTFGDPLEYSAGVGIRYKLPFVSFGLDVAQALSTSATPRLHLNITPVY